MMRFVGRILLVLFGIPLAACASQADLPSEPPQGLGSAWFHDDCAPWDGAAMTLLLGPQVARAPFQPGFPHLQVSLYSNLSRFRAGTRVSFEVPGNQGFAQYCLNADTCNKATGVTLQFSKVEQDLMEGRLEVHFKDRGPIRGSFRATRIPFRALCG
jgi:hypothetical protein